MMDRQTDEHTYDSIVSAIHNKKDISWQMKTCWKRIKSS